MQQPNSPLNRKRKREKGSKQKTNDQSFPPSSRKPTSLLLLIVGSFAIAAALTCFTVDENETQHRRLNQRPNYLNRLNDIDIDDDDFHRDGICRHYLMSFLNKTTDSRDECEGLSNAYEAAKCGHQHHSKRHLSLFPFDFGGEDDSKDDDNGADSTNSTDDDVTMIDDYFENFQCCSWIHTYYTVHCRDESISPFVMLFMTAILVVCGLVRNLLRIFDIKWFPEAAGCILVGAIAGLFLDMLVPDGYSVNDVYFNQDFFLRILLPPIVFEAALGINKPALCRHIFPVLALAVVGTILSSAFAGGLVYSISNSSSKVTTLPLLDSLLFGSLIATVDPVATLATFDSLGVSHTETLYILVFGESLLNDGVTIVLFQTIVSHLDKNIVIDASVIWEAVQRFFVVMSGSIGIGLASTLICTIYHWFLVGKQVPVVEVAVFFCWAFIPFYLTEGLGWSGIVAILTAGFAMDIFIVGNRHHDEQYDSEMSSSSVEFMRLDSQDDQEESHHEVPSVQPARGCCSIKQLWSLLQSVFCGSGYLSASSKNHIHFVTQFVSSLLEMVIFVYLGIFLFSTKVHNDHNLDWTAIFASIASRFGMIIILSIVINLIIFLGIKDCFKHICSFCLPRCMRDEADVITLSTYPVEGKQYIDKWTQIILICSGMRGAVSLALVESIPVYNAVTKRGSEFKSELKSMTTSTIIFTVFAFGCLTYHLLKIQRRTLRNDAQSQSCISSQAVEPLLASSGSSGLLQQMAESEERIEPFIRSI
mmetsp:Transcript_21460/g.31896  ORF Transcript_21460/g.31896 Transcript_21460/m.31896 type:complete len:761 (-) Transcript_21460:39-2321(-)